MTGDERREVVAREHRRHPFPHVSTVVVDGRPAETADDALALAMVRAVLGGAR